MVNASWIREMFEQGQRLKDIHGEDQVFDFSLGNPIMEPPPQVREVLLKILNEEQKGSHRYMPNQGFHYDETHIRLVFPIIIMTAFGA